LETVDVRYLAKNLAQVQIAIARLSVALMKKAKEERVTELPIPPPEFTGGLPPWMELLDTERERDDDSRKGDSYARGMGDERCDDPPGHGDKGPWGDTCDEEVGPGEKGPWGDTCDEDEEEDPLRDLCANLGRLIKFLWWLCWILRYRKL
jgi:hypothetical protein